MAIALVQEIGTAATPAAATTTVWSGSETVTVGNTIFAATATYDTTGAESCADSLGNTYTADATYYWAADPSSVTVWRATVTTGGTLTTVTWTHPSNATATLNIAEFSGVGTLASSDITNVGSGTIGTWASSVTIPANGIAVGAQENTYAGATTAGSASGSPSTSISVASTTDTVDVGLALLYAIAGSSEVTGFSGTATFASSAWNGVGAIYNPAPVTPSWTTPADTVSMSTTPELKFNSPASAVAQHFYLELDTANTFNTGSLRAYDSSTSQTNWDYWNGSAWTALPSTGLASTYAGNEIRYTVTSALSSATWYRRVRAGTLS